jgi:hypothetical protein
MQHNAPELPQELNFAGRCYVETDNSFSLNGYYADQTDSFGYTNTPLWWGNFNAYCSLNTVADECDQRPLCNGMQLAATGTVIKFRAYSTTNPTALPPTDMCEAAEFNRREAGSNSTSDRESQPATNKRKAGKTTHRASPGQQKVFLGEAYLYSGLISGASSHLQEVQFEGGRFEYVSPIRRSCLETEESACKNVGVVRKCGCFDLVSDVHRPYGWEEVDISQVPSGTPLVDGRIQTYKLKFY